MTTQRIETNAAPKAVGPYSQAVRAGGFLFTAGQIALDPQTNAFRADLGVRAQAELALRNLRAVLEAGGAAMDRVVKTTVFLTSMDDFKTVNEVYAEAFGGHEPARSAVAVAELPLGALVEFEAIAAVD